jgi:hypothetical protein
MGSLARNLVVFPGVREITSNEALPETGQSLSAITPTCSPV